MNTDHAFQIGRDHTICEDYALSGVDAGIGYAIVCDGCSASIDVDFGARAMAFAAKETLKKMQFIKTQDNVNELYENFGFQTIRRADMVFPIFPHLNSQALDTTLLIAFVKEKQLTVYMFGDGAIILRRKSGIETHHVQLTSGAPDYLSYLLDNRRKASYDKLTDNVKEHIIMGTKTETLFRKPFEPVIVQTAVEEGDIVAVCSDGINSFRKADNTPMEWKDLIDEFTAFKTIEGQFVLRRISAFKRKCSKDNTTHFDDISVAAITI